MRVETLRKIDRNYRIIYGEGLIYREDENETLEVCNKYLHKFSDEIILLASHTAAAKSARKRPTIIQICDIALPLHLDSSLKNNNITYSKEYENVQDALERIISESHK